MSLYTAEDERRIRSQALIREWTKSGLLDPAQGAVLEAELRVDVRRTNIFLRAGLAFFTVLIAAASVLFAVEVFDLDRPVPLAVTTALSAVVCLGLAQYLVVHQRFYRFGVEEALAAGSVALLAISAAALAIARGGLRYNDVPCLPLCWLARRVASGSTGGSGTSTPRSARSPAWRPFRFSSPSRTRRGTRWQRPRSPRHSSSCGCNARDTTTNTPETTTG